jgi:hypothetical protein
MPKPAAAPKATADPLKFQAQLVSRGPNGAWTYLQIPFNVPQIFGRKGQIPVRATINGFTFRNSLMPRSGVHILGVGKDILASAAASPGDTVHVELALDDAPRTVAIPADLESALAKSPAHHQAFAALAYSHKKEYVDWIESAKKPETRQARIKKMGEMLSARKTPKG